MVSPSSVPWRGTVSSGSGGRTGSPAGSTPVPAAVPDSLEVPRGPPIPPTGPHGVPGGCWWDTWLGLRVRRSCAHLGQRPGEAEGTPSHPCPVPVPRACWEEAEIRGGFYSLQEFIQLVSDFSSTEWVLNSYKLLRVLGSITTNLTKQTDEEEKQKKKKKKQRNNLEKQEENPQLFHVSLNIFIYNNHNILVCIVKKHRPKQYAMVRTKQHLQFKILTEIIIKKKKKQKTKPSPERTEVW